MKKETQKLRLASEEWLGFWRERTSNPGEGLEPPKGGVGVPGGGPKLLEEGPRGNILFPGKKMGKQQEVKGTSEGVRCDRWHNKRRSWGE